ncbi:hypothetical protein MMC25_005394 [Agyrium rufum]|nr:hypothetical protein [Agyrium rufum]
MADAGEVLFGIWGRRIFGFAQATFLIFLMASHLLTCGIMLNTLSDHAFCTVIFNLIGAVASFVCCLPRKLEAVSYMAILSFLSIVTAVVITMARAAVENPGGAALDPLATPSLSAGLLAVMNIIFAYAGHVAFFGFMAEMKEPKDYRKAIRVLQTTDTLMYLLAAGITYRYLGRDVASPALLSIGPLYRKIAFGCALPTILIGGIINGHVAIKFINILLIGRNRVDKPWTASYSTWVAIAALTWSFAFLITEVVPHFDDLLGLISAAFASWFTYGVSGILGLHLIKGLYWQKKWATLLYITIVIIGALICGLGLYASGVSIAKHGDGPIKSSIFACADNSL